MDLIIRAFIGLTVLLVMYLLSKDRGEHEPKTALWAAAGFGILGIIAAVILEGIFTHIDPTSAAQVPLSAAFKDSLLVGIIEESAKFIPLAIFIYRKRYFNENTDGVLYFALAGLAFGMPENLLYTLSGGAAVGIVRLVLTPYFHAATTAFIGYFLIRHKLAKQPFALVMFAFLGMILSHTLYDFGLMSGVAGYVLMSLTITFGVTASLFWLARRALKLDQQMGIASTGTNNFCRGCGAPNPKHNFYCARCGRQT